MMKLLHSADWHLDSPLLSRDPDLRQALLGIPKLVVDTAKAENAQLLLLSGDLFDGQASQESIAALQIALRDADMPVCIAPGNHDPIGPHAPWEQNIWPDNVYIFKRNTLESLTFPNLNCRVWGAAFTGPESDGLLEGFRAAGQETWQIGVLHGDPTQAQSPYCPITAGAVKASGLHYLALGHIHKGGKLTAGNTVCAWPGCPMGRGFDETGVKGVLSVTLSDAGVDTRFVPLDTPRFYDLQTTVEALADTLPASGSQDHYRVTLVGESEPLDLSALEREYARFPHLILRDQTVPPLDLWAAAGSDSLEGIYFAMLRNALEGATPEETQQILLAAKISRQLLEGQEVRLP